MIEKGAEIHPNSSFFQTFLNSIYVIEDVVGCVDKKARSKSIKNFRFFRVNVYELAGSDGEIGSLLDDFLRHKIRNQNTTESIVFILIIVHRMYEGVYLELLPPLGVI